MWILLQRDLTESFKYFSLYARIIREKYERIFVSVFLCVHYSSSVFAIRLDKYGAVRSLNLFLDNSTFSSFAKFTELCKKQYLPTLGDTKSLLCVCEDNFFTGKTRCTYLCTLGKCTEMRGLDHARSYQTLCPLTCNESFMINCDKNGLDLSENSVRKCPLDICDIHGKIKIVWEIIR